MEPDINNMTLNEYLMYKDRNRNSAWSYPSKESVAPVKNSIWVYPDSDEEEEEYYSLLLLSCFQTPQPCATINSVPTHGFTSYFFNQPQHTPNPPLDKEDSSFDEILDDLFRIGADNIRNIEHEFPNRLNKILALQRKKEEAPMEDIEMDEDQDIDHSHSGFSKKRAKFTDHLNSYSYGKNVDAAITT
ncbi:hypothetical protein Tco_0481711 [Tanacetum coccineum]